MKIDLFVSGAMACFSKPSNPVNPVSFDLITPTAARAVLESIYWHPGVNFRVERLTMLKKPRRVTVARGHTVEGKSDKHIARYGCLVDVAYRVEADVYVADDEQYKKTKSIISERLEKGLQYQQPYLGLSEFAADWEPWANQLEPFDIDLYIPAMPWYAIAEPVKSSRFTTVTHKRDGSKTYAPARLKWRCWNAEVKSGVLKVPQYPREALCTHY